MDPSGLAPLTHDPRPIGMFDSGFGGLTVARAVIDLLPSENLVYFGDTGRYPYGPRPLDEVADFAHQITRVLVEEFGVKAVVVACNTASAAALESLVDVSPVPVIGVIEPGARAVVSATETGRVGVIGTVGTIRSGSYQHAVAAEAQTANRAIELTCAACPGFVEFVERGETDSEQVHILAERLLAPVVGAEVDTLLLGCTHYPFLARTIGEVMGPGVVLVSSADETAMRLRELWPPTPGGVGAQGAPVAAGEHVFVSSGDAELFARLGEQLLGPEIRSVRTWEWPD